MPVGPFLEPLLANYPQVLEVINDYSASRAMTMECSCFKGKERCSHERFASAKRTRRPGGPCWTSPPLSHVIGRGGHANGTRSWSDARLSAAEVRSGEAVVRVDASRGC